MPYNLTEERTFTIYHSEDKWYYKFTKDEYNTIQVNYYEITSNVDTLKSSFCIPSDCIGHFISVLTKLKEI